MRNILGVIGAMGGIDQLAGGIGWGWRKPWIHRDQSSVWWYYPAPRAPLAEVVWIGPQWIPLTKGH